MVLLASALGDAFTGIGDFTPAETPAAIDAWAGAFETYFYDAGAPAIGATVNAGILSSAKALMVTAMAGINTDFPTAFQAGVIAFWGGVVTLTGAVVFTTAVPALTVIIPPPTLSSLAAAITAVGASNKAGELTRSAAAQAFAAAIHPFNLGGTVTQAVVPTPVLHPIL